jgi:thioester reductase-like protein
MGQIPCTVLRPAYIVGDSRTGEIDRFEGPYTVAALLLSSKLQVPLPLPGDGVAPFNVVPIDFVVDAATTIHDDARAVGRTFHIVDPNPSSSRRVYERVVEREGKKLPRLSLGYKLTDRLLKLPGLEKLTREQRMAFASVNHLSFYSNRNTLELLDGTGISCPPIESYLDKLIDYAQKARQKET